GGAAWWSAAVARPAPRREAARPRLAPRVRIAAALPRRARAQARAKAHRGKVVKAHPVRAMPAPGPRPKANPARPAVGPAGALQATAAEANRAAAARSNA